MYFPVVKVMATSFTLLAEKILMYEFSFYFESSFVDVDLRNKLAF